MSVPRGVAQDESTPAQSTGAAPSSASVTSLSVYTLCTACGSCKLLLYIQYIHSTSDHVTAVPSHAELSGHPPGPHWCLLSSVGAGPCSAWAAACCRLSVAPAAAAMVPAPGVLGVLGVLLLHPHLKCVSPESKAWCLMQYLSSTLFQHWGLWVACFLGLRLSTPKGTLFPPRGAPCVSWRSGWPCATQSGATKVGKQCV